MIPPKIKIISEEQVKQIFSTDFSVALDLVEEAFRKRKQNDILLPDKISQIFNEKTQDRINCMPATLLSDQICGVKWVSVFPENPKVGLRNVSGTIILSEIEHGFPISIMDGTAITAIRTAAVGAIAAKYLARKDATRIGFIGAGSEARKHLDLISLVVPNLKECFVSSRSQSTVDAFITEEKNKHPSITFIPCADRYEDAVRDADIIITATSTQADLLKANWISDGALYIHVGGWEDEYAVAQKAQKIVCDEWESIKHRTQTISRMYQEGLLNDQDIYADLPQIVCGDKPGRTDSKEFIYFCSVGLSYIDITFAKYVYDHCIKHGIGTEFEL